jgi:hypothetical protein
VNGGEVLWSNTRSSGDLTGIWSVDPAGGTPRHIWHTGNDWSWDIAATDEAIYWDTNQRDDIYSSESDEDYWVEDEDSSEHPSNEAFGEQPSEVAPGDTGFEMRSGEAAGDWKLNQQPGANS